MTIRKHAPSILLLAVAAVAAAGGYFAYGFSHETVAAPTTEPAEDSPAIPVAVEPLRRGELNEMVTAYGLVQNRPSDISAAAAPFESIPKRLHATVGERVEAGAVLVDLDASPDALLQLHQAEQTLAAAEQTAQQVHRRRDDQLATNADVTAAEQAVETAKTQLAAQKARGIGDVHTVKADQGGVVVSVLAQVGQLTAAGTPLVTIAPAGSAEVKLAVDPADTKSLPPGAAVVVNIIGQTNSLAGVVRQQSRVLNPQRMCDVFVTLNAATDLPAGTFVEGEFARQTVNGMIVPRAATQLEDDEWCVYTVKDDKAVRHVVKLGVSDGHDIVITGEGLADGDNVVVERDGELQDGAAVKVEADEDAK